MLRLDSDKPVEFCDGLRRRDFCTRARFRMLGLGLNDLFAMKALGAVDNKKDMNCIMLFLVGGPSQLDTWDMKPNAPIEIRGPYKPIKTNVPGIEISENFPRMAKHADKYALIRSVLSHGRGGTRHRPPDDADRPAVPGRRGVSAHRLRAVEAERAERRRAAARAAAAAHRQYRRQHAARAERRIPGQDLRSIRAERGPFGPEFQGAGHAAAGLSVRAARRPAQELAGDGGQTVSKFETSQDARLFDATFHQAYTLMSSQKAREAFELAREPENVREKYGQNRFGQSCLLARRLIEAGVRFVTVNMFETVFDEITWDIHGSKPFSPISCYRDLVGPMFDMAYSSLLEDLQDRGLLRIRWCWRWANSGARRR
jgi:hypothetical protein